MEEKSTFGSRIEAAWHMRMSIKGDKVVLIIVLLLFLISFLAIFSSTPLLPSQESRLETMRDHGVVALLGVGLMTLLYHFKIKWLKYLSQIGFILSFVMLAMLMLKVDLGFIRAETINGATRSFNFLGMQIHAFEVVKVAMVMYLAWAMTSINEDKQARKEKRRTETLSLANKHATTHPTQKRLKKTVWKRVIYV